MEIMYAQLLLIATEFYRTEFPFIVNNNIFTLNLSCVLTCDEHGHHQYSGDSITKKEEGQAQYS